MEDIAKTITIMAKDYETGVALLLDANTTFNRIKNSINQRSVLRSLSVSLAHAGLIHEARKLQARMSAQGDESAVGIIQADIAQSKARDGQALEADWEAQNISNKSKRAYARRELIAEKISASKFDEAIEDIGFLNDPSLVLDLFCELAEEGARRKHPSTAKFFQLMHNAAEQFLPFKFNGIYAHDHPYAMMLNAYQAADREQDVVDLILGEENLVRDLLLVEAIQRWETGEKEDFSFVTSLAERIDTPLERVSALATIAPSQFLAGFEADAAATIAAAESVLACADESQELYPGHLDMVRAKLAKAKSFRDPEAVLKEAEINDASGLLDLAVDAVKSYANSGNYKKALETANKTIGIDRASAFEYIALSYILNGNDDKACETLNNISNAPTRLDACASLISTLTFRKDLGVQYVSPYFSIAKKAYEEIPDNSARRDEAHISYTRICARIGVALVAYSKKTLSDVREKGGFTEVSKIFAQKAKERDRAFILCMARLLTDEEKKEVLKKVQRTDTLFVQDIFRLSQNL